MSVAFRRDSDEEHREPRFELPLPPGPNLVTPRGLVLIEARNAELDAALAAATGEARDILLREQRYWRTRLATARIVPPPTGNAAAFGSRVTVMQGGRERTLDIVGHDEGDPDTGRIAFRAPIAQALIGGEVGDEVELPGQAPMTVLAISAVPL